jgi:hypothetical protein
VFEAFKTITNLIRLNFVTGVNLVKQ